MAMTRGPRLERRRDGGVSGEHGGQRRELRIGFTKGRRLLDIDHLVGTHDFACNGCTIPRAMSIRGTDRS
jgi:hypothetical protein